MLMLVLVVLAAPPAGAGQTARIASATGRVTVHGETYGVHVVFAVPRGRTVAEERRAHLARLRAKPWASAALGSGGFSVNGLAWPGAAMTQHYNPAGQPSTAASTAFSDALATWNGVSSSRFTFTRGADTTRCPSLVDECPGAQTFDGNNDVGWLPLSGSTLGVTWYATSGSPEADVVLNTNYAWSYTCANVAGAIDAESVFLHENGHALGLGHSTLTSAVMYPSYSSARCALGADDIEGVTYLYPEARGILRGTVTDTNGNPLASATVKIDGTGRQTTTGTNGTYSFADVAYPVTYDIAASVKGASSSKRVTMSANPTTVDFSLNARTKGGGGGGGKPRGGSICDDNPDHRRCA